LAEDKIVIKQFKDSSSNWFVNNKHYHLNEDSLLVFICGGVEDQKETEAIKAFISRNKKTYKEREPSIFEIEQKEYSVISYGKYSGKSTQHIVAEDRRYARWIYDNTSDRKVKEELKELLKIK
jgi:hypothetical protein